MSESTVPPAPPAIRSGLLNRLRRTPLRDLLRGRVSGRLDINAKLKGAGLSVESSALIRKTVKRTKLWRLEKTAVADELIAHFKDAAEARPPAVNPVADYGDPIAAAKLIRRAKIRLRGPLWHVWVWFRRGVVAVILFYAAVAARFFTGTPTVSHNYFDDFNADARALPEHEKAWPIYRDAWLAIRHDNVSSSLTIDYLMTVVRPRRSGLAKRQASSPQQPTVPRSDTTRGVHAGLGFELRPLQDMDPADRALIGGGSTSDRGSIDPKPDRAEELAKRSIVHLLQSRSSLGFRFLETSMVLAADTDYAVQQGDQVRARRNLETLLGLYRHTTDAPWGRYPALQVLETACGKTQDILIETPEFWSDAELTALKNLFERLDLRPAGSSAARRAALYDLLQRIFTDNGRGDGRITPEGLRVVAYLKSYGRSPDAGWSDGGPEGYWTVKAASHAAMPRVLFSTLSRKETLASIEPWVTHDPPDAPKPLWEHLSDAAEASPARLSQQRPRPGLLEPWLIARGPDLIDIEKREAAREGTLVAIAIEQYRRQHGGWPLQLEELVPDHLSRIPFDRINGKPLKYRLTDEGPRVYSVGGDRDDDGGHIARGRPGDPLRRGIAAFWLGDHKDDSRYDGDWAALPVTDTFTRSVCKTDAGRSRLSSETDTTALALCKPDLLRTFTRSTMPNIPSAANRHRVPGLPSRRPRVQRGRGFSPKLRAIAVLLALLPAHAQMSQTTPPSISPLPVSPLQTGDLDENQLVGTVTDEAGVPLPGVLVDAWSWCPGEETTTDEEGRFQLTGFDPGEKVQVLFSKPGFSPAHFVTQPVSSAPWAVVLTQGTWIEGRVLSPEGDPVPDAVVRASRGPFRNPQVHITEITTQTRTGPDGAYRLHLEPAAYDVRVRVGGVGVATHRGVRMSLRDQKPLDIHLQPGITLRAVVRDSVTLEPVEGIVLGNGRQQRVEGVSDGNGRLEITGLPTGDLRFGVRGSNPALPRSNVADEYARWWSPQASLEHQRDTSTASMDFQRNFDGLTFTLAGAVHDVEIFVEPCVTVNGRVLDPNGQPVAGATVAPSKTGSGNSLTGDTRFSYVTDDEGRFAVRLPASKETQYNLIAHDGKYQEWRTWANATGPVLSTTPGQVIDDVELHLTRPATVRGRVTDAAANPQAQVRVRAAAANGDDNRYYIPETRTDADGRYALEFVAPGRHLVRVAPRSVGGFGGAKADPRPLDIIADETIDDVDFQLN